MAVGCLIARMPAEIDIANAGQVRSDLLAAIDRGAAVVVADLSRTSFCDCAGVSALLAAASHAARAGAELRVVARASAVLRTFTLTGLVQALPVYPISADAVRDARVNGPRRGPSPIRAGNVAAGCAGVTPLRSRWRTGGAESVPPPGPPRYP
jgi:anti-sigma B factor antagonist